MKLIKSSIKNIIFKLLIKTLPSRKASISNKKIGVCTLLCHRDVDMFIYNISSFFYHTGSQFPIYIVDDGSLYRADINKLKKYFTIIYESQKSSRGKIKKLLVGYQYLQKFRFDEHTTFLKKKFDSILLNPFDKFIYLDADVLFFQKPQVVIDWLKSDSEKSFYATRANHLFNIEDVLYDRDTVILQVAFRRLLFKYLSLKSNPSFSSSFLCIPHKKIFNLKLLNNIFRLFYETYYAYTYLAEETALGIAVISNKSKILSQKQYACNIFLEDYLTNDFNQLVFMHYAYNLKYMKFKKDAIYLALKNKLYRK